MVARSLPLTGDLGTNYLLPIDRGYLPIPSGDLMGLPITQSSEGLSLLNCQLKKFAIILLVNDTVNNIEPTIDSIIHANNSFKKKIKLYIVFGSNHLAYSHATTAIKNSGIEFQVIQTGKGIKSARDMIGYGVNYIAKKSSEDYFLIIKEGDILSRYALVEIDAYFSKNKNVDVIVGKVIPINSTTEIPSSLDAKEIDIRKKNFKWNTMISPLSGYDVDSGQLVWKEKVFDVVNFDYPSNPDEIVNGFYEKIIAAKLKVNVTSLTTQYVHVKSMKGKSRIIQP